MCQLGLAKTVFISGFVSTTRFSKGLQNKPFNPETSGRKSVISYGSKSTLTTEQRGSKRVVMVTPRRRGWRLLGCRLCGVTMFRECGAPSIRSEIGKPGSGGGRVSAVRRPEPSRAKGPSKTQDSCPYQIFDCQRATVLHRVCKYKTLKPEPVRLARIAKTNYPVG